MLVRMWKVRTTKEFPVGLSDKENIANSLNAKGAKGKFEFHLENWKIFFSFVFHRNNINHTLQAFNLDSVCFFQPFLLSARNDREAKSRRDGKTLKPIWEIKLKLNFPAKEKRNFSIYKSVTLFSERILELIKW